MNAEQARATYRMARLLEDEAKRLNEAVGDDFEWPLPGSIMKHCHTGKLVVLKDQNGIRVVDSLDSGGVRVIEVSEAAYYDVIQVGDPTEARDR